MSSLRFTFALLLAPALPLLQSSDAVAQPQPVQQQPVQSQPTPTLPPQPTQPQPSQPSQPSQPTQQPLAPGAVPQQENRPPPSTLSPQPTLESYGQHSINLSPLGLLFGAYALNYEYLHQGSHGLLVEGNFSRSVSGDISATGGGAALGYRYHWSGSQDSGFLGATVSYAVGSADASVSGSDGEEEFNVKSSAATVTGNVGRRWAWSSGFNITLRIGLGRAFFDISTDSNDEDAKEAVKDVDELLNAFPVAFDGELSIGIIF